jgi:antitoxin component YwqK of YwqJK toxin-antitoxin module
VKRVLLLPLLALGLLALPGCRLETEVCTSHYNSGRTWSVRFYRSGLPDKKWIVWYANQNPYFGSGYDRGARDGQWDTASLEGREILVRTYAEDELNGPWRRRYTDGTLMEEGQLEDGLRTGTWRRFRPDGSLELEAEYAAGVYSGAVRRFDADGALLSVETYP